MNTFTLRLLASALFAFLAAPALLASTARAAAPTTRPSADEPTPVQKIKLAQFESMRRQKDAIVLDVRTPREFAAGHVPGAINIDWHSRDFADRVAKLDNSKTYLLHCQAGVRSAAAARKMSRMDFTHLFDFSGGWSEYSKSGKPVEKPNDKVTR